MLFFIYCFTKTVNWEHYHVVKQDVLVRILALVELHGAEVAYPTQVVDLKQLPANSEWANWFEGIISFTTACLAEPKA